MLTKLFSPIFLVLGLISLVLLILATGLGQFVQTDLVYVHRKFNEVSIIEVDPRMNFERVLYRIPGGFDAGVVQLVWSHDGHKLAFAGGSQYQNDIYLLDLSSPNTVARLTEGLEYVGSLSWSADDTQVRYNLLGMNTDQKIYSIDLATRSVAILEIPSSLNTEITPALSPVDDRIAFVSDSEGTHDVYTVYPDGQSLERWTTGFNVNPGVIWSPNGQQLLLTTQGNPHIKDFFDVPVCREQCLFVLDTLTGTLVALSDLGAAHEQPAWSPTGQHIAFVSNANTIDSHNSLFIIHPDGKQLERLTEPQINVVTPLTWSQNASWIGFCDEQGYLYIVNIDNKQLIELTTGKDQLPVWRSSE